MAKMQLIISHNVRDEYTFHINAAAALPKVEIGIVALSLHMSSQCQSTILFIEKTNERANFYLDMDLQFHCSFLIIIRVWLIEVLARKLLRHNSTKILQSQIQRSFLQAISANSHSFFSPPKCAFFSAFHMVSPNYFFVSTQAIIDGRIIDEVQKSVGLSSKIGSDPSNCKNHLLFSAPGNW